jgi:hypothetical protein
MADKRAPNLGTPNAHLAVAFCLPTGRKLRCAVGLQLLLRRSSGKYRFMRAFIAALMLLVSTPAFAKAPPQPPEPASHPNWADVARTGVSQLMSTLFDPTSAQINWSSGFQWGFTKQIFMARTFGWVVCGTINAKNRMGGYLRRPPGHLSISGYGRDHSAGIGRG